ncbi:MAG: hypothetical protein JSS86_17120 [Cyanobacteria bacterium SZAS LIN-2]|nr:hypothetical protein [Cyanobacteria bacterium SZAS LIN-2]
MSNNEIYEAALKPPKSLLHRVLYSAWLVAGLFCLMAIAWAEPWSTSLFNLLQARGIPHNLITFVGMPLVMTLRAILLVESFGYLYHRFFQHVGFFTRRALVFRKNQRYHWMHHMWIYPIGRFYKRAVAYVTAEKGFSWSWLLPALLASSLFALCNGFNASSAVFILALGLYAKYVIDLTHCRFHMNNHPWAGSKYFHWLEDIHVLHHWDQRTNFTIVHPLMDMLFGTYLSPKKHQKELAIALGDNDLTASDLINWRYVLLEATPAERAAFVTNSYKHSRSIRKVGQLLTLLKERTLSHPADDQARDLYNKAVALLEELGQKPR